MSIILLSYFLAYKEGYPMRIICILLFFTLSGCMSTEAVPKGPIFNYAYQASEKATAYFYQDDMPGTVACLLVGINGNYEGCIGYPGYTKIAVDSGIKNVSFTPNSVIKIANLNFDFKFESGKEYFFKYQVTSDKTDSDKEIETQYNMALGVKFGWYLVEKEHALKEMENLRAWHKSF